MKIELKVAIVLIFHSPTVQTGKTQKKMWKGYVC